MTATPSPDPVERLIELLPVEPSLILRTGRKSWVCRTCGTELPPGTRHIEYVGEAYAFQSGKRYCLPCTAAEWNDHLAKRYGDQS